MGRPSVEPYGFSIQGRYGACGRAWVAGVGAEAIAIHPGSDTSTIAIALPEDARIVVVMNMQPGPIGGQPTARILEDGLACRIDLSGPSVMYQEPHVWTAE